MKRIKGKDNEVEDLENFRKAFSNFSKGKTSRNKIKAFMENLDEEIETLRYEIVSETWVSGGYTSKKIKQKKERVLGKAPIRDHVIEAAAILPYI